MKDYIKSFLFASMVLGTIALIMALLNPYLLLFLMGSLMIFILTIDLFR